MFWFTAGFFACTNGNTQVQTSCGFGVPLLTTAPVLKDADSGDDTRPVMLDRDTLGQWARKQVEKDSLRAYQAEKNACSLDGCPGLRSAMREKGEWVVWELLKARVKRVGGQREAVVVGAVIGGVMVLVVQVVLGMMGLSWMKMC